MLEYKTQTQISQYKTSNQIHLQQPSKIQIIKKNNNNNKIKIKKKHKIRERKNASD